MKHYLIALSVILVTFICAVVVYVYEISDGIRQFLFVFIAQVLVNTILHFALCVRGKTKAAALPVMWALCLIPLYVYSFHLSKNPGFLGSGFLFTILGLYSLLPVFVVSVLTAGCCYGVRRRRRDGGDT